MTGIHGWKVSWQADLIRRKCCRAKRLRCGTLTDLLRAVAKQKERCAGAPWDTVASHPAHSGFWKVQQEQLQTHLLGFFFSFSFWQPEPAGEPAWSLNLLCAPWADNPEYLIVLRHKAAFPKSHFILKMYVWRLFVGGLFAVVKKEKKKASTNAGLRFSVCKIPIFKSLICYFRLFVFLFFFVICNSR